ncbi:TMEM175 family protein [Frateuria defendens]|uniref:TMEM175 family protein n=1 Tax=Frateuria defendens TaxID=2219559 RepID=UPI00066FE261|nr:TMEM175 family protein [Frateuria defendens]
MGERGRDPVESREVGRRHLERLVMLSDGIFAIAITLSAIEIKPEPQPGQTLWQAWSTPLLVYFLSFVLIGAIWASHRRIVAHLRDIDGPGTAINLLLLSLVALMPVVIRFVLTETESASAFPIYAAAVAATFGCLAVLWAYAAFFARLAPDVPPRQALAWLLETVAAPLIVAAGACYEAKGKAVALLITVFAVLLLVAKWRLERSMKPVARSD